MKRTADDDDFAIRFGAELTVAYNAAKADNQTDEDFADSIGVVRQQLKKYLNGSAVPSLRTVSLAKKNQGVSVAYAGTQLLARTNKRGKTSLPIQLSLPLTIKSTGQDQLNVRVKSASSEQVELELVVRRVS